MAFGARGLFSCNSINIHINTDRIVAYGAYAKGLKVMQGSLGIEGRASNKDLDWRSMSEVERNSVLTLAHERDHFRLLVGTPVGDATRRWLPTWRLPCGRSLHWD